MLTKSVSMANVTTQNGHRGGAPSAIGSRCAAAAAARGGGGGGRDVLPRRLGNGDVDGRDGVGIPLAVEAHTPPHQTLSR